MITVNDYTITEKEFDLACNDFKRRLKTHTLKKEYVDSVKDQLIDARLLLDAAKKNNIAIDTKEVSDVYDRIVTNFPAEEDFLKLLESEGDTIDSLKDKIKDDIMLKKYINDTFVDTVTVADKDVLDYYNDNKDNFKTESKVKASHILFDEKDLDLANEVKNKIVNGSNFVDMAKEHSKCPSSQNNGELGYFAKGQMVPEFEKVAFKADIGIVNGPVKTQFGYHLIVVYDKTGEKIEEFDNVKEELKNHLKNTLINYKITEATDVLKEKAHIVIDNSKLEAKYNK